MNILNYYINTTGIINKLDTLKMSVKQFYIINFHNMYVTKALIKYNTYLYGYDISI